MKITSDDYVVINAYAGEDTSWIGEVDTPEKRRRLVQFSLEVAEVFICMGAYVPPPVCQQPGSGKKGGF